MAGNGRYPSHRLDRLPLAVAARMVSDKLQRLYVAHVWIVPTTGIIVSKESDSTHRWSDPERYRHVGTFDRDAALSDIAAALAPYAKTKVCRRCTRALPLTAFHIEASGHPRSQCKQCLAAKCVQRRRERPVRKVVANPLNLALRDMPGNRGQLFGAPEWRAAA